MVMRKVQISEVRNIVTSFASTLARYFLFRSLESPTFCDLTQIAYLSKIHSQGCPLLGLNIGQKQRQKEGMSSFLEWLYGLVIYKLQTTKDTGKVVV